MKHELLILIVFFLAVLISPTLALNDYQRGVLDGLKQGWSMAQKYDQAKTGDPIVYNQAVSDYNTWIEGIFGRNETLMLKPLAASTKGQTFLVSGTITPIHAIDATWNKTQQSLLPQPDASGLINGYPAETYYSIGPAIEFL